MSLTHKRNIAVVFFLLAIGLALIFYLKRPKPDAPLKKPENNK